MPGAATIQPAAPGPRAASRAARARRDDPRGDDASTELDGERPGWLGGDRRRRRRARRAGRAGRPVRVRTTRRRSATAQVIAGCGGRGTQRLGGGVAVVRTPARDLVELHRPDRADPGPPRRHRLDRRRGPRRQPVHAALPANDAGRPDRDRRGRWPGRASAAGSAPRSRTMPSPRPRARRPVCAGSSRRLRDVRIEDAWGGPIDITADHLPTFASRPRPADPLRRTATRATASRRRVVGGRILAALARRARRDDPAPGVAAGRRRATRVPAGAVPLRRGAGRSRGDRAPRGGRGARRAGERRSCASSPACRGGSATTSGPD